MLETQDGAYANAACSKPHQTRMLAGRIGPVFFVLSNAANPASAFNLDREKRFANEVIAHLVAGDAVTISPAPGAPANCHSFWVCTPLANPVYWPTPAGSFNQPAPSAHHLAME